MVGRLQQRVAPYTGPIGPDEHGRQRAQEDQERGDEDHRATLAVDERSLKLLGSPEVAVLQRLTVRFHAGLHGGDPAPRALVEHGVMDRFVGP